MKQLPNNAYSLNLVEALLGAITPNFRAVAIDNHLSGVRIRFLLEQKSPSDAEEIDEVLFKFEALCPGLIVEHLITVSDEALERVAPAGRLVYLRREKI